MTEIFIGGFQLGARSDDSEDGLIESDLPFEGGGIGGTPLRIELQEVTAYPIIGFKITFFLSMPAEVFAGFGKIDGDGAIDRLIAAFGKYEDVGIVFVFSRNEVGPGGDEFHDAGGLEDAGGDGPCVLKGQGAVDEGLKGGASMSGANAFAFDE